MIDIITVAQTKAFARQDGALLALLWIAAFFCTLFIPGGSLGRILTLSTPLFVFWRLLSFRDYALEGIISYRKALYYCVFTFFYASFIFDSGQFMGLINTTALSVISTYKEKGIDVEKDILASIEPMMQLSPLNLSFIFMIQNVIIGFIISIFLAFLGKVIKRKQNI